RQVEQASRRIANIKDDKRFCISNGWLTQLENSVAEPGICKLFSLSAIYRVKFLDLIRLYDIDVDEIEKFGLVANPNSTRLLSDAQNFALQPVRETLRSSLRTRPTSLLPGTIEFDRCTTPNQPCDSETAPIAYGYIGLDDRTMYPMIRPGSIVRIDTAQNKLERTAADNEYGRPIYFVELRDAYACGWCELHGCELFIVPHHSSPGRIRRFTYIKDAEIVGRVVGYDTGCIDQGK